MNTMHHKTLLWIITLAAVLVFVRLGFWQLARANEVEAITTSFAAKRSLPVSMITAMPKDSNTYQDVSIEGVWLTEQPIIQANVTYKGIPGIELLYPFQTNWGILLVNIGFNTAYHAISLPSDRVQITGQLAPKRSRITLKTTPWDGHYPRIVQTMDEVIAEEIKPNKKNASINHMQGNLLAPLQLHLSSKSPENYIRDWKATHRDPERHRAYALQWFLFAAIAAIIRLRFSYWPRKP